MSDKVRETILITDDYEMNREILKDMLGDEYNILGAADGTEDLIEKLKIDYYETTDLIKQYEQEMDEI